MKINSAKRQLRHSQRVLPQFDVALSLSSHTKWRTSAEREKERESVRHSRSSFAARRRRRQGRLNQSECVVGRTGLAGRPCATETETGYDAHAAKHRSCSTRDQFVAKRRACQKF